MKRGIRSRRRVVAALGPIVTALALGSCAGGVSSSGGSGASGAAGKSTTGGPDGAAPAATGCATDADCASQIPPTMPIHCAAGKCDALQGTCVFVAKDQDGDGHPAANCQSLTSVPVTDGDDCDDTNPNLYPGHPDNCSASNMGAPITWPTGKPVGSCLYGQVQCLPSGGVSACMGAIAPNARNCGGASMEDDDCDGIPDDTECKCKLNATEPCFAPNNGGSFPSSAMAGNGICANGTQTCIPINQGTDTTWGNCVGAVGPLDKDACVAKSDPMSDANCDGVPNEGCTGCTTAGVSESCAIALGSQGSCAKGMSTCTPQGTWGPCSVVPTPDTCDEGNDNSCNGIPNEGCTICGPGQTRTCGNCNTGIQACAGGAAPGTWGNCVGASTCNTGDPVACTTCSGSAPAAFSAGTQICNSTCNTTGVACVASASGMTVAADDSSIAHDCGYDHGQGGWNTPDNPPMCSCLLQYGPKYTLPAGTYTWTVSGITYSDPNNYANSSIELLVTSNGESSTPCLTGSATTVSLTPPINTAPSVTFTVTQDCCPVYLEIEWLCTTASRTGTFTYTSNHLTN